MLALIVGSDYKLRVRAADDTLSGGADVFVLLEVAVFAVVGGWLLLSQRQLPHPGRLPLPLVLACAYVGVLCVSVSYSPFRSLALVRALEMLVLLGVTARGCYRASRADLHRFAHGFLLLVSTSVLVGVAHPEPPVFRNQAGRFSWLRVHPISAGVFTGIATVVALVYLLTRLRDRPGPRWPGWAYALVLLLPAGGLVATETRNAILGVGLAALVVCRVLYGGRTLLALVLAACLATAATVLAALGTVTTFFVRGESAEKLATLNSRTDLWGLALSAFEQRPVFGYGLGATRGLFLTATGLGGGHNAVINVAVDLGLTGLCVWAALLVVVTRRAWSAPAAVGGDVDRALLLGVLAFFLVDGLFFEGLGAAANVAADWLLVVVVWVVVLHRRAPG